MKKASRATILSSVLIIVTSLFFFFNTLGFKKLASQIIGPEFMPRLYAFLLIGLSIILIIQSYMKNEGKDRETSGRGYFKYSIITMLFLGAYIIIIPIIGFYISTIIFVVSMLLFSRVRNKIVLAVIPVATSIFIYVFFSILLNVNMPSGFIF